MKKFGAVATIVLPLTLVAGMFGMNVKVPFRDVDNTNAFWTITGKNEKKDTFTQKT